MKIFAHSISHTGYKRKVNQDRVLERLEKRAFAICDGMGGHQGGEVAAYLAVQTISEHLDKFDELSTVQIQEIFQKANSKIWNEGQQNTDLRGMGTTCTFVQVSQDLKKIRLAHIGDSRLYFVSKSGSWQITKDHTWVQERLDLGISEKDLGPEIKKNVLTKCLGMGPRIDFENLEWEIPQNTDSLFFLCSDGIHGVIPEQSFQDQIASLQKNFHLPTSLQALCENFQNEALKNGGSDNLSIICFKITQETEK